MTVYTNAQLATRMLKDLGLTDGGEAPSAVDLAWAIQTVSAELELLRSKNIILWDTGEDAIPTKYLTVLSRRIGLAVAPSFGLSDIATATVAMEVAERDLRILGSVPATGEVQTAEYF